MLKFASLGSGSEGNSFLVKSHQATVMVDCGFNFKETSKRLKKLDIDLSEINGILITHEHEDHCKAVQQILKNNKIKIYSSYGTAKRLNLLNDIEIINSSGLIQINDIKISVIPVPHDASEPCHYVFESSNTKIGIITDFGFVTNKIKNTILI
jgi:phosphoribosyl 1,2-cyclic phosphodiesterase